MKVSIIIVSYNVRHFLQVCLHSVLRASAGLPAEVIVVDNASSDDSVEMIRRQFPAVSLIANTDNKGFSKANNQAVAIARGEYVLFLNPDTVMPEEFLRDTISWLDTHPEAGALGPRLIDGKGRYAPDGKKSFPTLSVAIFKTAGLHRIFPRSAFFNKYYAAGIGERETAPVEVLSGCCMMVRRSAMDKAGGPFDEDYFMYCEDVDLAYRIHKSGAQNIYYPEATLVHYKGESTRKATVSYVRIFNEALNTFVRKHYSKGYAKVFRVFIQLGIILRAVLGVLRNALRVLRMPLIDMLILLATLWVMKEFWVGEVKGAKPVPLRYILGTFPAYLGIWIVSLYFNGAYDMPYRALRVVRGMLIGTVGCLAFYGLLGPELRYSRVVIVLSAAVGTVALLGLHEALHRLGIYRLVHYDAMPRKAVIVADEQGYSETMNALRKVHYAPQIAGRISTPESPENALAPFEGLKGLVKALGVDEVIFCINGLTYSAVLQAMQDCGPAYDYKIHLPGSTSFVGSNSSATAGDLYTTDMRFNLSQPAQRRNKRVFDMISSVGLLLLFPVLAFVIRKRGAALGNIFRVLAGNATWVGYSGDAGEGLPRLREHILPVYGLQPGFALSAAAVRSAATEYALHYVAGTDFDLLVRNVRYIGG